MGKFSPNKVCPCGSANKYKKCCSIYHKGALPPTALLLMKSRYCAYAVGDSNYIIKTTHPDNPDYTADIKSWKESILSFSKQTNFLSLEIIDFIDGKEEAFVTFNARLSSGDLKEKSRFLKLRDQWFYVDGEFL
jgi:SEC-C motif-containing protein